MILIALGANLPGPDSAPPAETIAAAIAAMPRRGIVVAQASKWYETQPVPASDQDPFVNVVLRVETDLDPEELMRALHALEDEFGRHRGAPNAARTLDIDLIDYDGRISQGWPLLPHPRVSGRAFVLVPLRDVAPEWRHPASGADVQSLIAAAPDLPGVRELDGPPDWRAAPKP